jgi:phosphate transport system substrate-binding protein
MATVGYCSNYGTCSTANAKDVVDLKSNRDHCPICGMALHPIADLEPLLVAAAANRSNANPAPAPETSTNARVSVPETNGRTTLPETNGHTTLPETNGHATLAEVPVSEPPAAPEPLPRTPRTEHFSDPDPVAETVEPARAPAPAPARSAPSLPAITLPTISLPKNALIGAAAVAGLIVIAALAWMLLPRAASGAVAFRVCGTDALQGQLGFDLVQGFLTSAGGSNVATSPFSGGEATVSADLSSGSERISIRSGGSAAAYAQIADGSCQIAIAGRPPTGEELAKIRARYAGAPGGFTRGVASDGIVVVVNPLNRVGRLSLDAVRRIFTGAETNWSAFGGENVPIAVIAPTAGSDVFDQFGTRVLHGASLTGSAKHLASLSAVSTAVAHDRNAVGVVTFSDSSPAKVVALEAPNHGYVAPSALSIGTTYPLSEHFGLYAPTGSGNAVADRFVAYLASDEAQSAIGNAGFVPSSR